jgi:hypothetical protein
MNQQLPRRAPVIAAAALAGFGLLALAGCSKADPEENCRLWMNNDAGWAEMSLFVADKANDAKLRGRCLEILVAEGGQPSQVLSVTEKAPDRVDLLVGLEPAMIKLLQNGSVKQKGHAKIVLFAMLKEGKLPEAKATELKAKLADWAFADFKHDMDTESLKAALKERVTPDDIEVLGPTAVPGVEVMLGKGISKGELVAFLKSQNTPEAKKALVAGLKRYHSTKNVKISEDDLGAIQATDTLQGYVYFLELYRRFADVAKPHPDDKRAADLAIRVALQWTDPDDDKKKPEELEKLKKDRLELIKGAWDQVGPLMDQLLTGRNCDDRWYATQMLVATQGAKGLETALGKLPDDTNYGQEEFAANDAKKMIVDLCLNEIKALGVEAARPVLEATLKSNPHAVSRLVAARCLATRRRWPCLRPLTRRTRLASRTSSRSSSRTCRFLWAISSRRLWTRSTIARRSTSWRPRARSTPTPPNSARTMRCTASTARAKSSPSLRRRWRPTRSSATRPRRPASSPPTAAGESRVPPRGPGWPTSRAPAAPPPGPRPISSAAVAGDLCTRRARRRRWPPRLFRRRRADLRR